MPLLATLLLFATPLPPAERLAERIETCRSHRELKAPAPPAMRCKALDADVKQFLRTNPPLDQRLTVARALSGWAD